MAENYPSVKNEEDFDIEVARKVRRAIIRANKLTFWRNKCLINSFCARRMLNKRNIPSEAHLGIRKTGNDLAAHAWVNVSNIQVVPKEEEYTKVFQF